MILEDYLKNYKNTEEINKQIFVEFTELTNSIFYLKEHRDYIETNNLGFGDRAFQYMWFLIINYLKKENDAINVLEIGVFKGQIISLWDLIAKKQNINIKINAITPLNGNPVIKNKIISAALKIVSKKYRDDIKSGNHYDDTDYKSIITKLFERFSLNFNHINLIQGFSNDPLILEKLVNEKYDLIYIDGDHSYEGALNDIISYSNKLNTGGILVIDDASCNIPGNVYWKGHQSVSDACELIDRDKFNNIINVGHNRVYQKK